MMEIMKEAYDLNINKVKNGYVVSMHACFEKFSRQDMVDWDCLINIYFSTIGIYTKSAS